MATITTAGPGFFEKYISRERLSENVEAYRYKGGVLFHIEIKRDTPVREIGEYLNDIPGPDADQIRNGVLTDAMDGLAQPEIGIDENQILVCVWYQK